MRIFLSNVGIFQVKIELLDEVMKLEKGRFDVTNLADGGPFNAKSIFANAVKYSINFENKETEVMIDSKKIVANNKSLVINVGQSEIGQEAHTIFVNLDNFEISHEIDGEQSSLKINSNNLLSIESTLAEDRSFDSNGYWMKTEKELTNEKPFHNLKESIPTGP